MKLDIQVDASAVQAMLVQVGAAAESHVKAASLVTGRRVADEARGRIARRTGETAGAITVQETERAVLVYVGRTSKPEGLPAWLEFGTRNMTARPWLLNSARLEEGAHLRRVNDALVAAIKESGG